MTPADRTAHNITGATQAERDLMAQSEAEIDAALAEAHPWATPGRAHQAAHRERRALALAARVIEAATTGKRWWQQ